MPSSVLQPGFRFYKLVITASRFVFFFFTSIQSKDFFRFRFCRPVFLPLENMGGYSENIGRYTPYGNGATMVQLEAVRFFTRKQQVTASSHPSSSSAPSTSSVLHRHRRHRRSERELLVPVVSIANPEGRSPNEGECPQQLLANVYSDSEGEQDDADACAGKEAVATSSSSSKTRRPERPREDQAALDARRVKWLDLDFGVNGGRSALLFDVGHPVQLSSYELVTANDFPERGGL